MGSTRERGVPVPRVPVSRMAEDCLDEAVRAAVEAVIGGGGAARTATGATPGRPGQLIAVGYS